MAESRLRRGQGMQDGVEQFTSLLYDSSDWSTQMLEISHPYSAFFSDLASHADKTALLFEAEGEDGNQGIQAVWLQQPADCDSCDMNCDGVVNAFDIEPFLDRLAEP